MTTRHYLHGDKIEGTDDQYFCQRCDAFVLSEHFATCELGTIYKNGKPYKETHAYRYAYYLRRLKKRLGVVKDPENLFRDGLVGRGLPPLIRI
jgi:hypothetical protein